MKLNKTTYLQYHDLTLEPFMEIKIKENHANNKNELNKLYKIHEVLCLLFAVVAFSVLTAV